MDQEDRTEYYGLYSNDEEDNIGGSETRAGTGDPIASGAGSETKLGVLTPGGQDEPLEPDWTL